MTAVLTPVLSILAITALAWAAKRMLRAPVCPVCMGVGGTWLWMLVARHLGLAFDTSMLPVLLGGSAVGIAYQVERRLPEGRSALLWKSLFIPFGLAAAYGVSLPNWTVLAAASVALAIVTGIFFAHPQAAPRDSAAIEKLQEQMKKCC